MAIANTRHIVFSICFATLAGCTSTAVIGDSDAAVDVSTVPDVPMGVDVPTVPDVPVGVDVPTVPDVPVGVDVPAVPDVPTVPDVPVGVDVPAVPDVPVGVDVPAVPDVPVVRDGGDACVAAPTEVCDGVDNDCDGEVDEGFCRIGGVCFTHMQRNPANACLVCTLTSSTRSGPTAWSNVAAGTLCRTSTGACDPTEACAGDGSPCPADRLAPGGAARYTRSPSPLAFIDACAAPGAHRVLVAVDQAYTVEGLPFSFRFFGAAQTVAVIAVNGMVSFSSAAALAAGANATLPHAVVPSTVFAFWDDLQTRAPGVCIATVGAAPDRRFVVEWRDAGFAGTSNPDAHLDFEVVLSESTHTIDALYRRMDDPAGRAAGGSATIGLQGVDATAFDLAAFDTAGATAGGGSFRWTPVVATVCRPSTGVCDPEEVCTGASAACPSDGFISATTMCRPPMGACDTLERCTGSSGACPADAFMPAGSACGTGLFCARAACCPSGATPLVEICNNVDDDCNGAVDDGVTRDCYTAPTGTAGVGACRLGSQTCTAGAWGACGGVVVPSAEVCDRLDNNCNGAADEGIICP
jgi:hypothetical protein